MAWRRLGGSNENECTQSSGLSEVPSGARAGARLSGPKKNRDVHGFFRLDKRANKNRGAAAERPRRAGVLARLPNPNPLADGDLDIGFLQEVATRLSLAPPLHEVLREVVRFAAGVVECDSCFVYVLEKDELVLRASKNPHPEIIDRLKLKLGEGITGWVAEHREPAAVPQNAMKDPRFKFFNDLREDHL